MSWQAQAWVWKLQGLSPAHKLVALSLANYADPLGQNIRPGLDRIAHETGCNESTVKRAMADLQARGHLLLVAASTGRGNANVWAMPVPPEERGAIAQKPMPERGALKTGKGCISGHKGVRGAPPTLREPKEEPKTPLPPKGGKASVQQAFADFWALYPRKVGKVAAEKAFAKAAEHADQILGTPGNAAIVTQGLQFQILTFDLREEMRFVKHPASWLNAGCWLDAYPGLGDPEPPASPQPNLI